MMSSALPARTAAAYLNECASAFSYILRKADGRLPTTLRTLSYEIRLYMCSSKQKLVPLGWQFTATLFMHENSCLGDRHGYCEQ